MKRIIKFSYRLCLRFIVSIFYLINLTGMVKFYQPIPQLGFRVNRNRTKRSVERWGQIVKELPETPMSCLDIGSNVGYYSINLAERGHFVTAIDKSFYALIIFLVREVLNLKQLSSYGVKLNPNNINSIPNYDCILFLSVFHHWCREFGKDSAMTMLDTVYNKANKMIVFETGQTDTASDKYKEVLPDMGKDPESWLHAYFNKKGCSFVKTLGVTRERCLILIKK